MQRQTTVSAFRGRILTGTDWFQHTYSGEHVAILATGAEAASILPEVLQSAAAVTVFEESAAWIAPVAVPSGRAGRLAALAFLRFSVRDSWTRRQLTPHSRFDSADVEVSPSYYGALRDSRTRLIHWPTYAVVEQGVRAADGVEYRVDTIVVGATSKFAKTTEESTR